MPTSSSAPPAGASGDSISTWSADGRWPGLPALSACTPVTGRHGGPVAPVPVDDDLVWITRVPAVRVGSARAASPAALVHLCLQLAEDVAAAGGAVFDPACSDAELIVAAARAVADYLDDLPDLPLVGEPFGGEEGTD